MNRRDFFRGLLAITAIIPTVSTKTIVDMAANTWRPRKVDWGVVPPATIGFYGAMPIGIELTIGYLIEELKGRGLFVPGSRELEGS